ncbi:MAG: YSC84-related protein [Sulfurimicrobium sp.]|nr:YSC84-related protein [Sulfurimicrobium sp.]
MMFRYTIDNFRSFSAALILSFLVFPLGAAHAKSEKEIDASVNVALERFKKDVKGADDYLKGAKGVLVLPDVKKAGFVIGAQWGEGALRVGNKSVAYYKMDAGSVGFQAGYQEANFVFLFLTQEALDSFRASKGWTAGVEGGITVVEASAGLTLDTLKAKDAIVAFVFGKEGLMAGWSAKGTKFTKLPGK